MLARLPFLPDLFATCNGASGFIIPHLKIVSRDWLT